MAVSEIDAFENLGELPVRRRGVHGRRYCAIARDGLEGERLPDECVVARELPLLPPVALHVVPISVVTLDGELLHVSRAGHVRY